MPNRLLCAFAAILLAGPAPAADPPRRPNVLVLFADDQRADTIAAWGNPHIRTPNLDRLVAPRDQLPQQLLLRLQQRGRLRPQPGHADERPHLARRPARPRRGHAPAGSARARPGTRRSPPASGTTASRRSSGRSPTPGRCSSAAWPTTPRSRSPTCTGGKVVNRRGRGEVLQRAVRRRGDRIPRVATRATSRSSATWRSPPRTTRGTRRRSTGRCTTRTARRCRRTSCPLHPFDNGMTKGIRDENLAPYPRTREVIGDQLCEYYGHITYLDEQVGRILAALEETRPREGHVVVYTADHGLALGSHGLLGKQSLYEHSMKCPLIIAGPGVPAGQSTAAFTYLLRPLPDDLRPRWREAVRTGWPARACGRSGQARRTRVRDSVFLPFSGLMRVGARRAVEADRLPADQPPPAVRPAGRPGRDAGPRRRPGARSRRSSG